MKKMLLVLTLALAVVASGTFVLAAGGGPTTTVVDAEQAARALITVGAWTQAIGSASYVRVTPDGVRKNIFISFTVNRSGWFTSLTWDGVVLVGPGDAPIGALPNDTKGMMTQFNIWFTISGSGGIQVYGSFYTDNLKPSAPIVIELRPGWAQQFVPFSSSLDPTTLRLMLASGGFYGYDAGNGGFWVWLDPLSTTPTHYQIIQVAPDGTETVLVNSSVIWGQNPSMTAESALTLRYVGGVIDAYLGDDGLCQIENLPMVSTVQRNGTWVNAAVLMTDALGQPIYVGVSGFQGTVEIRDPNQGMKLILSAQSTADNYNYAVVNLPSGYGRLVITVTGQPAYQGESIYFYVSGGNTGGGGGLGAPAQQ